MAAKQKKVPDTNVTIIKAAPTSGVISSNAMEQEDAFAGMYYQADTGEGSIIQPPFDPKQLKKWVTENNALGQCVAAMEVNIDGTGYEIDVGGEDVPSEAQEQRIGELEGFFEEPYPGQSFVTQRRALRVDLEEMGYAFLEVIRNPAGDLVFLRPLDASTVRIPRLGEAVVAKKMLVRNGKNIDISVNVRERAFVQVLGNKKIYFKEYGASRDINKKDGSWGVVGEKLPATDRGTELLYFTVRKDATTPYGVPRWISQTPSVVGSRQAEEMNLSYFDSGGIPPALIFVQGGVLAEEGKVALENIMSGKAKDKMKAAICEVMGTSGGLESASSVSVEVERFGSEQQKDSMFEGYDGKCERRVRSSFRLPPLFVGKAEDYSYATAFASYSVAEAQVFKPERDEFDEIMNVTIMRELDPSGEYKFRSKTLSVNDSVIQLKAIELGGENIDPEDRIKTLNDVSNLSLKYIEVEAEPLDTTAVTSTPIKQKPTPTPPTKVRKGAIVKIDPFETAQLADDLSILLGLVDGETMEAGMAEDTRTRIDNLSKEDKDMFDAMFAARTIDRLGRDPYGLTQASILSAKFLGR